MHDPDNFESCYVGLLALMWADLEAGLQRPASPAMDCPIDLEGADLCVQALRIELSLLAGRTDDLHEAAWMTVEQAAKLRSLIDELRALLDFTPADERWTTIAAITRAQDRLFDEVLEIAERQAVPRWPQRRRDRAIAEHEKSRTSTHQHSLSADVQVLVG